ncbi:MAG: T9SS type A sorting domain-containing protein [Dysgonamonadaceae bacterium]|jgi:hypothetical protein|nr:T9SS type A sorting domain-containing protein [Dysgonamonadaceae bacterium]
MDKNLKFLKRFFVGGFLLLSLGILNGHAQGCTIDDDSYYTMDPAGFSQLCSGGTAAWQCGDWGSDNRYLEASSLADIPSGLISAGTIQFAVNTPGKRHIVYTGTDPLTIKFLGSGSIYFKSTVAPVTITGTLDGIGRLILDGPVTYTYTTEIKGNLAICENTKVIYNGPIAVHDGCFSTDVGMNIYNRGIFTVNGGFRFNGSNFFNNGEMLIIGDFYPSNQKTALFVNNGRIRVTKDLMITSGTICLANGCFDVDKNIWNPNNPLEFVGIMGDGGGIHFEGNYIFGNGSFSVPLVQSGQNVSITAGANSLAQWVNASGVTFPFEGLPDFNGSYWNLNWTQLLGWGTFLTRGDACGDYTGNVTFSAPDQEACEGDNVSVNVFPQDDVYEYQWFKSNGAGGWTSIGSRSSSGYINVIKSSAGLDVYYVDVYDVNLVAPVKTKHPVNLYLAAAGECNSFVFTAPDVMACEGDNVRLNIFPQEPTLSYEWFKSNGAGGWISQGVHANGYFDVIKGSGSLDSYAVDVRESSTLIEGKFPVNLYLTADTLVWTGSAGNKDWNDAANWNYPGTGSLSGKPELWIPRPCTNVLIPAGKGNYPDLSVTSTTIYSDAACNKIWFRHGGEVVRTDLLNYKKANLELTLEANRWNMITVPLRYVHTGDFYKNDPCPHADKLRIYQQLFETANPQPDATVNPTGGWTGPFNNPEIAIPAGFGYAVHLLDDGTAFDEDFVKMPVANETDWVPATGRHSIWFPKNDKSYNVYWLTSVNGDQKPPINASCENEDIKSTHTIERGSGFDNYRFVYEAGSTWNTTGDITLTTSSASAAEKAVIVGNPFMSHWDFDKFAARNTGKFKDEYKVLESGNDAVYVTYSSLISSNKLIAPMQSILITSNAVFGTTGLKTNVEDMAQKPGNVLKSASNTESNLLKIVAEKDDTSNQTHILFDVSANNNYVFEEDSYKLFVTDVTGPIAVYTRSSDGVALDINVFGDTDQLIPLGVRTSQTGNIDLRFEGVENFGKLQLIDTLYPNDAIDLKETPEYSFKKTTSDLFLDGRFFLSFKKAPNSDLIPTQGAVSIFTSGNQLQVISDSAIDAVQIFDMQGRLLKKATNVRNSCILDLPQSGVYIVKVLTKESSIVEKVMASK